MIINPIIPIWLMAIICIALAICKRKGKFAYIRQIIMIILLFMINLRMMIPTDVEVSTKRIDANVFFVIDNTISMTANDCADGTTRMDALKADCNNITGSLSGARFSLITFANISKLVFPLTESTSFVNSCIKGIGVTDELYAKGSSMNICKDMVVELVKAAHEKNTGKVIVFFISDGEITNGDTLDSFKEAAKYIDGGAVLGYGTSKGGNMYIKDYFSDSDDLVAIEDKSEYPYKKAVSKIDEENLKAIAKDMGIEYINMTTENKLDTVIDNIKKDTASLGDEDSRLDGYKDIYFIFIIPLLGMLVYEFINHKANKKKHYYSPYYV